MYDTSVLKNYLDELSTTNIVCDLHLKSNAINGLRYYRRSTFLFMGCKDSKLYFYANDKSFDDYSYPMLLVYDNEHDSFSYSIVQLDFNQETADLRHFYVSLLSHVPHLEVFDNNSNDYSQEFYNRLKINNNYVDDFIYSNNPSEYFVGMLYFAIPILLFVVGLKVFKKGLFR